MRKIEIIKTSNFQNRVQDAKNTDSRIMYCTTCRKCWEILTQDSFTKRGREIRHYIDFPSYGKTKQKCDLCKGEKNGKNVMDKLPV